MRTGARACLAIFALGFALETAGTLYYALYPGSASLPVGTFLVSSWVFTLVGLPVLWFAQGAWSHTRAGRRFDPGVYFGGAMLLLVLATVPILWPLWAPATPLPSWTPWAFAASVAGGLSLAFVSYGSVGYAIAGSLGRLCVAVAVLWAIGVALTIGLTLAGQLPQLTQSVAAFDPEAALLAPAVVQETAYFAVSYALLFLVYLEAALRVPGAPPVARWRLRRSRTA